MMDPDPITPPRLLTARGSERALAHYSTFEHSPWSRRHALPDPAGTAGSRKNN